MGIGQNLHRRFPPDDPFGHAARSLSPSKMPSRQCDTHVLRPWCQTRPDPKKTDASGLEQNDENPWLPKSMGFALVLKVLIKFDPYPTDSNTLNPCFPRDLKLSCLVLTVCQRPIHKAASSLLLENRCPKIAGSIMV